MFHLPRCNCRPSQWCCLEGQSYCTYRFQWWTRLQGWWSENKGSLIHLLKGHCSDLVLSETKIRGERVLTQSDHHESSGDTKGPRVALHLFVNTTLLCWKPQHTCAFFYFHMSYLSHGLGFAINLCIPLRMGVMMVDSRLPALMDR